MSEEEESPSPSADSRGHEDVLEEREVVLGDRNGPLAWIEYVAMRATVATLARLPHGLRTAIVRALAHVASKLMTKRCKRKLKGG